MRRFLTNTPNHCHLEQQINHIRGLNKKRTSLNLVHNDVKDGKTKFKEHQNEKI